MTFKNKRDTFKFDLPVLQGACSYQPPSKISPRPPHSCKLISTVKSTYTYECVFWSYALQCDKIMNW